MKAEGLAIPICAAAGGAGPGKVQAVLVKLQC